MNFTLIRQELTLILLKKLGTNEDIIYDGMKATVWITVTRDGDALVSTVANPKDTVFNNYVKDVQPAKAKFELTKVSYRS